VRGRVLPLCSSLWPFPILSRSPRIACGRVEWRKWGGSCASSSPPMVVRSCCVRTKYFSQCERGRAGDSVLPMPGLAFCHAHCRKRHQETRFTSPTGAMFDTRIHCCPTKAKLNTQIISATLDRMPQLRSPEQRCLQGHTGRPAGLFVSHVREPRGHKPMSDHMEEQPVLPRYRCTHGRVINDSHDRPHVRGVSYGSEARYEGVSRDPKTTLCPMLSQYVSNCPQSDSPNAN